MLLRTAAKLDPTSALVVEEIAAQLSCILILAVCLSSEPLNILVELSDLAARFAVALAVLRWEKPGVGPLNHWDAALAFWGVRCLMGWMLA